eukprot:760272-Hanusia_phi.AAC.6
MFCNWCMDEQWKSSTGQEVVSTSYHSSAPCLSAAARDLWSNQQAPSQWSPDAPPHPAQQHA